MKYLYDNIDDIKKDHPNSYIKYREGNYIYYYANVDFLDQALKEDLTFKKMIMADFVVDIKNNTMVKCRTTIEDIVDRYILNYIK